MLCGACAAALPGKNTGEMIIKKRSSQEIILFPLLWCDQQLAPDQPEGQRLVLPFATYPQNYRSACSAPERIPDELVEAGAGCCFAVNMCNDITTKYIRKLGRATGDKLFDQYPAIRQWYSIDPDPTETTCQGLHRG